mmetsp:Transcript_11290/g.26762  ORF Transcript_11290/g.26762 Transcript_11290/m.26762 type:complete len:159 (-) Transcript_11290:168-644(-)
MEQSQNAERHQEAVHIRSFIRDAAPSGSKVEIGAWKQKRKYKEPSALESHHIDSEKENKIPLSDTTMINLPCVKREAPVPITISENKTKCKWQKISDGAALAPTCVKAPTSSEDSNVRPRRRCPTKIKSIQEIEEEVNAEIEKAILQRQQRISQGIRF